MLGAINARAREIADLITILVGDGSLLDLQAWAVCVEAAVNATPEKIAELRAATPSAAGETTPAPTAGVVAEPAIEPVPAELAIEPVPA